MSFTNHLRSMAQPIWDAQFTHPFVTALAQGSLLERKFKYYILQDALFLRDLAKVFAAGALRSRDTDSALGFAKLAEETITVEQSLHVSYGTRWKMSTQEMTNVSMAPTTYAYTRHMLTVAHTGSVAEIAVVTLPCAWIYCLIGQSLLQKGLPRQEHPYRDWLMLYASPEFAEVQKWLCLKIDQWAKKTGEDEKQRMEESFIISSRYEWMFWEMPWNEEQWPI